MKRTIKLYRVTTTYVDPYARDYWSTRPATNELHPATGLPYDEWTDGGAVEFVLPEGVAYDEDMGMLYDEREGRYLEIHEKRGEPYVLVYRDTKGITNTGSAIDKQGLFEIVLKRA